LSVAVALVVLFTVLAAGCGGGSGMTSRGDNGPAASTPGAFSSTARSTPATVPPAKSTPAAQSAPQFVQQVFKNNKTIHFVSSDPPCNALLSTPPSKVTINFSSDLGSGSFISVAVNGLEVTSGPMLQPIDNRSVTANITPALGTGNYLVKYAAYWSDGSYCEGSFGFSVKTP
jgi:methionine-rich copper-binding protein CopC